VRAGRLGRRAALVEVNSEAVGVSVAARVDASVESGQAGATYVPVGVASGCHRSTSHPMERATSNNDWYPGYVTTCPSPRLHIASHCSSS
jgi:hypothetical protein